MTETPPFLPLSERLKWAARQTGHILMYGDIRFACVVLGCSMWLWATLGMFRQADIVWFAKDFAFEWAPWIWAVVYYVSGYMFIHVAIHNFPPMRTLLFGTFCVSVWTLVAVTRPTASFSSGWTLNIIVIFMGAMLAHRSGRHHRAT